MIRINLLRAYHKAVAAAACVRTQSTKNMPFPVTEEDIVAAIYKVDEIGKVRA